MQLFYHPNLTADTTQDFFSKEESKHIIKVLRKKTGDRINITNGKGHFFVAIIEEASPSKCTIRILEKEQQQPLPYYIHLAVAPTKLNDRYEWFLEKATEIGISEITPIYCDHSERTKIKPERYEKILLSAMKQSLKAYLPKLNKAISFKEFITRSQESNTEKYIAHCEETQRKLLKDCLQSRKSVTLLIGPEGDFSTDEIALALQNDYTPVSLGNSRLRTETAAIVACHSVAFVNE